MGEAETETKTGYLVIKIEYRDGDDDLTEISSEADYEVKHPAIVDTEVVGISDDWGHWS
jgi:hypothetical protein